jgi:hypothetical protein
MVRCEKNVHSSPIFSINRCKGFECHDFGLGVLLKTDEKANPVRKARSCYRYLVNHSLCGWIAKISVIQRSQKLSHSMSLVSERISKTRVLRQGGREIASHFFCQSRSWLVLHTSR